MDTSLGKSAGVWNSGLGDFISEAHEHLATVLHDYSPYLSLSFIPKMDLKPGDKPFAIIHAAPGKESYVVRFLTDEDMKSPATILAWVFDNDTTRTDVLSKLENADRARQLMDLKAREEENAQHIDMLEFMAKTPLHTFSHDGRRYQK